MAYFALLCVFFGSNCVYLNMSRSISKCARLHPLATSRHPMVFFLASSFSPLANVFVALYWVEDMISFVKCEKRVCVIASTFSRKPSCTAPSKGKARPVHLGQVAWVLQVGDISKTTVQQTILISLRSLWSTFARLSASTIYSNPKVNTSQVWPNAKLWAACWLQSQYKPCKKNVEKWPTQKPTCRGQRRQCQPQTHVR